MKIKFINHKDVKTVTAKSISMLGCELHADGKSIAYFDRDSGAGWMLIHNNVVNERETYSLEIEE